MKYQRLKYEQYFIDNSEDFNSTGKARRAVKYTAVEYRCGKLEKLFGMMHEMNYEIFYEKERDVIQINFQKSNGKSDWFANIAEFSSKYYDSIDFEGKKLQLRTHHGWAAMYKSIKHEIRDEWKKLHEEHPDAYTEIIGWSLGSGQAMLCAQDLNFNFGVKPYLYTYGSVRPFKYTMRNKKLMLRYLDTICEECRNFSNVNDIVTYMPFFYGFTMIKRADIGLEKRNVFRLFNPNNYHRNYHIPELYK